MQENGLNGHFLTSILLFFHGVWCKIALIFVKTLEICCIWNSKNGIEYAVTFNGIESAVTF